MTAFPDNCTCHWVRNEDGRPECEVGRECSCLHHCWCEDQSRLDCDDDECGGSAMTPEEKIEALREWANKNDEPDFGQWASGYHKALTEVRDIIDPPKPKWREMVDLAARSVTARDVFTDVDPLADVLSALSVLAAGDDVAVSLAHVVAICEKRADDGWQADPERVHPGGSWGVAWLLVPLSHEPPDWAVVGDRSAAWLRELCK